MGRAKTFDETAVLEQAMGLFWENGYGATSMKEVEAATGLRPGSLYHSFGSKHDLFVRVLDHYIDTVVAGRITEFLAGDDPIAGLRDFFTSGFAPLPDGRAHPGCLMTNTATEIGAAEAAVAASTAGGLARLEQAFAERLALARRQGRIAETTDPRALAAHLTACFLGIMVTIKLTQDTDKALLMTEAAIAALR